MMNQLDWTKISATTDPRLEPYRNLRERTLRGESIFIAEGRLVTERLIASPYPVESVLISEERFEAERTGILASLPSGTPVYVAEEKELLDHIVGFEFYQGILALGRRVRLPNFVEGIAARSTAATSKRVWVVLPKATKPDNLGLIFRCSAALGAEAVVLGEECCDPFSRRALRVSMGGVLQLPIYQAVDLEQEIRQIQTSRKDVQFYATILDDQAENLESISDWSPNAAFLFGNEFDGLAKRFVDLCDRKLTLPMRNGVDSLNLGVSVAVFLYEFQRAR